MTFTLSSPPTHNIGDYELRRAKPKEGSQKVQYRAYRYQKEGARKHPIWRMTLIRLEWFPKKKTWRLIETKPTQTKTGSTRWKQITRADLGDIPEAEAVEVALATINLLGY